MVEEIKKDDEKPEKERKLEGLLEAVVLFVKKVDYERIQSPLKITVKPLFKSAPNIVEGILQEMEEWGNINRDAILYKLPELKDVTNFNSVAMAIIKSVKEVQEETQKNKDKIKKLELDKKFKELEQFKKKLSDIEKKREKELIEKKAKLAALLEQSNNAAGLITNLADEAEARGDDNTKEFEAINILKDDKAKE